MSRLQSKITIVTGSSSGLGRAIALAFASEGAGLVVCADLHPIARGTDFGAEEPGVPTHEVIQKRFGEGKAIFVRTDVSVSADVEDLVKKAVEIGGRLDVYVFPFPCGGMLMPCFLLNVICVMLIGK